MNEPPQLTLFDPNAYSKPIKEIHHYDFDVEDYEPTPVQTRKQNRQKAKKFRLGQLVRLGNYKNCFGIVEGKTVQDSEILIRVLELKEENGPPLTQRLISPAQLTIVKQAPKPNFPRDVPKNDSVTSAQVNDVTESFPVIEDRCRSCSAPIYWGKTAKGKPHPLNPDSTSHFSTCPDAQRWRKRATKKNDSLTSAQINDVTESSHSVPELVTESSPTISGVTESSPTISTYSPAGGARGENLYFRLSWREGSRVRHRHIRGGNIRSVTARSRMERVKDAIARGMPIAQILLLC